MQNSIILCTSPNGQGLLAMYVVIVDMTDGSSSHSLSLLFLCRLFVDGTGGSSSHYLSLLMSMYICLLMGQVVHRHITYLN